MINASKIFLLAVATAQTDHFRGGPLLVYVETGYSTEGLPSQVLIRTTLAVGDMVYMRETVHGHTVITHYNHSKRISKAALDDGRNILVSKERQHKASDPKDTPLQKPDKSHIEKIAGYDCYRVITGPYDETWVPVSNTKEPVAFFFFDRGVPSTSVVCIENRKSLPSDIHLFDFPTNAHIKWVSADEFEAFHDKYAPDTTPDWVWTSPLAPIK